MQTTTCKHAGKGLCGVCDDGLCCTDGSVSPSYAATLTPAELDALMRPGSMPSGALVFAAEGGYPVAAYR